MLFDKTKIMLSVRDWIWVGCIVAGLAFTNGMMSSRVTAIESQIKDLDMLRIDARLSVIEVQVKEINQKLYTVLIADGYMKQSWIFFLKIFYGCFKFRDISRINCISFKCFYQSDNIYFSTYILLYS